MSKFLELKGMRFNAPSEDITPEQFLTLQDEWKSKLDNIHDGVSFLNVVVRNIMLADCIAAIKLGAEKDLTSLSEHLFDELESQELSEKELETFKNEHVFPYIKSVIHADRPGSIKSESELEDKYSFNMSKLALSFPGRPGYVIQREYIDYDSDNLFNYNKSIEANAVLFAMDVLGHIEIIVDETSVFYFRSGGYDMLDTDTVYKSFLDSGPKPDTIMKRLYAKDSANTNFEDKISKFLPGKWMSQVYELNDFLKSELSTLVNQVYSNRQKLLDYIKKHEGISAMQYTLSELKGLGDLGF